ncbi:MAG: hypothetical protein P1P64_02780 [Treponemataceae bacterium]
MEPEDFLSSIFDHTDLLDEMIEYIRPARTDRKTAHEYDIEILNEE